MNKDSPSTTNQQPRERFLELDVFRGLAAFGVVLFHYTSVYNSFSHHTPEMQLYFSWGRFGVELFFIISGFVILLTLDNTKQGKDFIFKRFSRLYPAYWVAIILTFIVITIDQSTFEQNIDISFFDAIINLTMFQSFFNIPNVDPVYWTLGAELCFYIMMFILFKLKLLKHINIIVTAWLTLAFIISLKTYTARWGLNWNFLSMGNEQNLIGINTNSIHPLENVPIAMIGINTLSDGILGWFRESLRMLLNLKYAHLFIIGIILYQVKKKGFTPYTFILLILSILEQKVAFSSWERSWDTTFFVAWTALILYLATQNYLKFIVFKPLIFLGTISYPLYLIHQIIGYIIINNLYKFHLHPYLIIFITIVIIMAIASLISIYIEQPSLNFLRQKYKKLTTS